MDELTIGDKIYISAGTGTFLRNRFGTIDSEKRPGKEKRRREAEHRKPLKSRLHGKLRAMRRTNQSGYQSF